MRHRQRPRHSKILLGAMVGLAIAMRHGAAIAGVSPPSNDACADAAVVPSRFFEVTQDTVGATAGAADPIPPCGNGSRGKSVWYEFTVPESGPLTVDTFDSSYDTILTVYTGGCDAPVLLPDGCSDDHPDDGAQSKVEFQADVGVTYLFMVSAFDNDGGSLMFTLNLFRAPNTPTPTATVTPTFTQGPGPLGDANCDGRVSAADLPALATLIGLDARAPCRRDDGNGDNMLDEMDRAFVVGAIFASSGPG